MMLIVSEISSWLSWRLSDHEKTLTKNLVCSDVNQGSGPGSQLNIPKIFPMDFNIKSG